MEIIWKAAVTLASGAVLLMFGDYIRSRVRIAREMVTRTDCGSCRKAMSETDRLIFNKLDEMGRGLARIEGKLEVSQ